jgi:two-component system, sensor histidine kinase and response regulator
MILRGKRIFITEDNLTNRSVMQLLLEHEGAIIGFERFGRETCERLRAFAPVDIILLDLMFPDNISGYDVFDRIRAFPEFAAIPIIAVSATEPSVGVYTTQAKGFSGFISKPIDRRLFAQQIATVLDGEEVWYAE